MARRERFHPQSPVQADRTSPVPLIVAGVLLAAVAWQARDSWIEPLAPPYAERTDTARPANGHRNQPARPESARGNLLGLFTSDDYPVEALKKDEQGSVTARLQIDRDGRVSNCTVVQSSGSESLDTATCKILQDRARFTAARNSEGETVTDSYTQRVVWQLQ